VDDFLQGLQLTHASLSDKLSLWCSEAHAILQAKENSLVQELNEAISVYSKSAIKCVSLIVD